MYRFGDGRTHPDTCCCDCPVRERVVGRDAHQDHACPARGAGVPVRPRRRPRGLSPGDVQPARLPPWLRPRGGGPGRTWHLVPAGGATPGSGSRRPVAPRRDGRPDLLRPRRMHLLVTDDPPVAGGHLYATRRATLERRVRWVVSATITYNLVEAVVAITAGRIASSTALVAFGLDSFVEVLSAAAVAWQFAASDPRRRERAAMRAIAISFFGLGLSVAVDAVRSLLGAEEAGHSTVGIVLAAVSLAIMPAFSWFERRTGRELGSASAVADSKQTLLCAYLSAVLLGGLVLNVTLGWGWEIGRAHV